MNKSNNKQNNDRKELFEIIARSANPILKSRLVKLKNLFNFSNILGNPHVIFPISKRISQNSYVKSLNILESIKDDEMIKLFLSYIMHKQEETNNLVEKYARLTCEIKILTKIDKQKLSNSGILYVQDRLANATENYHQNLLAMAKIPMKVLADSVEKFNKLYAKGFKFEENYVVQDACQAIDYGVLTQEIREELEISKHKQKQPNTAFVDRDFVCEPMPSRAGVSNAAIAGRINGEFKSPLLGVDAAGNYYVEVKDFIDQNALIEEDKRYQKMLDELKKDRENKDNDQQQS